MLSLLSKDENTLDNRGKQFGARSTLLFNPTQLIGNLHKKTHFKAGETIKNNINGSLKVDDEEYYHLKFMDIRQNI